VGLKFAYSLINYLSAKDEYIRRT